MSAIKESERLVIMAARHLDDSPHVTYCACVDCYKRRDLLTAAIAKLDEALDAPAAPEGEEVTP